MAVEHTRPSASASDNVTSARPIDTAMAVAHASVSASASDNATSARPRDTAMAVAHASVSASASDNATRDELQRQSDAEAANPAWPKRKPF
eukprot:3640435-Amphidinium_carterae.1